MKMIAHHRQKLARMRIDEAQTIPVMVIIKENNQELFYFLKQSKRIRAQWI
jgi:hypothetical protein